MLRVDPVIKSSPKEPISAKGILIITISENRGDSNCIAITRKIRNTATKIAVIIALNSSILMSSIMLDARETPLGSTIWLIASSAASCAVNLVSSVVLAVTAT